MGQPVVHFEIIGSDPAKLRSYYGELFAWEFDTGDAATEAVSQPGNYGFVDGGTTGGGINGGVGGGEGYEVMSCSMWAFPMSRPRSRRLRASVGSAAWALRARPEPWWSGSSPTRRGI
jgi:hypothetical protein